MKNTIACRWKDCKGPQLKRNRGEITQCPWGRREGYFYALSSIHESSHPLEHGRSIFTSRIKQMEHMVVSVDYRRAPEHPLPAAYDDSWAAIKWAASHSKGGGPEVWLNECVDFDSVFFAGDSAGANIAHHMGIRVGSENPDGFKLVGIALIHPYFGGEEPIGGERDNAAGKAMCDKLWLLTCPTSSGSDDPLFNPGKDPNFSKMGCGKVLVCVGEKDMLRDRGWYYKEELVKSGWGGVVEVMEAEGENHVFHLINPTCDNAVAMLKRLAAFMNLEYQLKSSRGDNNGRCLSSVL
ncbi:hypothetical protein RHMOL_Rhmol11G0246200 [Rhododendron molle]|uniref:Uncharacterized protein n=1 Tax=Rhododendron molle TaxID=49168 RepID=A0ACC0LW30_RHOML|nr:hypothetical protein RHMOL_Rhmol11G0246200 [Rhododendron molle]